MAKSSKPTNENLKKILLMNVPDHRAKGLAHEFGYVPEEILL